MIMFLGDLLKGIYKRSDLPLFGKREIASQDKASKEHSQWQVTSARNDCDKMEWRRLFCKI